MNKWLFFALSLIILPVYGYDYNNESYYSEGRVVRAEPIYEKVYEHREKHCKETYHHSHHSNGGQAAGAIIGGIAGSNTGSSSEEKVFGAIAGGIIGSAIGRNIDNGHRYERKEYECYYKPSRESSRVVGYRVEYRFNGRNFITETREHPGRYIEIRVNLTPTR